MIAFIKGILADKKEGKIIVECNGIGYEVLVSNTTLSSIGLEGENIKIYTYMQVREDDISLIGFSSIEEKNLFELLISVNGIGPKMALGILSGMRVSDILISIASGDSIALSRIKGLGKKTAERIVLELKDKVTPTGLTPLEKGYEEDNADAIEQAYMVLLSLGLTKNEAMTLARTNSAGLKTPEEIVAKALKNMGR